jgi:hypothetical protein
VGRGCWVGNPPTVSADGQQVIVKYGIGGNPNNLSGHVRFDIQTVRERPVDKSDERPLCQKESGDLKWNGNIDCFVQPPFDVKHVVVQVEYFDGQPKTYDNTGIGRYLSIVMRDGHVTVTPRILDSNLQ